jgi:DNA-binding transcriptional MerR regulator
MSKSAGTQTYGPAEVAAAIGVKRGTLHSWFARRVIEVASQGAGIERRFTFGEAVWLGILAALTRHGLEIGHAQEILHTVRDDLVRALQRDEGHGSFLLLDGDRPWIGNKKSLQRWWDSLDGPIDPQRPADTYMLMLGPLVARTKAALEAAEIPRRGKPPRQLPPPVIVNDAG